MTKISPQTMSDILDALAQGYTIPQAAATVDMAEGGLWTAKRNSRLAFEACDFTKFYIPWRGKLGFFHELMGEAVASRRHPVKPPETEWTPDNVSPPRVSAGAQSSDASTGTVHAAGTPLPPYHRSLRTAAVAQPKMLANRPPVAAPAIPRPNALTDYIKANTPRVEHPSITALRELAKQKPANPYPRDARGNRTIISTGGMRADDPEEKITGA
jgi:hypothetical protein